MNKKFVLLRICLVAICLSLSVCILNKNGESNKSKELNLNRNDVQKINISDFPSSFKAFDIDNEEQVQKIIDYLASINTIETKLNPSDYCGGGYSIKVYLSNGSIRYFGLLGNKFFVEKNRFTYEVSYNEATKFDTIVANILDGNEEKTGELSITGRIISVNAEASGRDIACVIKDEGNITYNINVEHAKIIDGTGKGWLILHQGDVIKVFYQKDEDGVINALTVYIKTSI